MVELALVLVLDDADDDAPLDDDPSVSSDDGVADVPQAHNTKTSGSRRMRRPMQRAQRIRDEIAGVRSNAIACPQ